VEESTKKENIRNELNIQYWSDNKLQKERFAEIYSKRERGDIVKTHNERKKSRRRK
jgi:hypothetical protein